MLAISIATYAAALIIANLTVAHFGPSVMPVIAFALIGLDLALRDVLHKHMRPWQMGALIAATGAITYALNPAAQFIAVASAVSFVAAAAVDWFAFSYNAGGWMRRSNVSNAAGAIVDSFLFPTIAFGVFMPEVIAAQMAAKMAGGFLWSLALRRIA